MLAQRPFRFRDLAAQLQADVGEHVDDNAVSRSLQRLTRSGLVTADAKRVGRRTFKTYRPTSQGRQHAETYQAIVAVITRKPGQGQRHGCCIHGPHRTDEAA